MEIGHQLVRAEGLLVGEYGKLGIFFSANGSEIGNRGLVKGPSSPFKRRLLAFGGLEHLPKCHSVAAPIVCELAVEEHDCLAVIVGEHQAPSDPLRANIAEVKTSYKQGKVYARRAGHIHVIGVARHSFLDLVGELPDANDLR